MGFDAIIFDCDGVLVDSEIIAIAVEREHLSRWGLVYDQETYVSRFVGLHNRDYHANLRADSAQAGVSLPEGFEDVIQQAMWARFEAELQPIEGAADLVASFGGPVAVASSSGQEKLRRKLEMTGLAQLFGAHVYSADLVMNGKPSPDLFLHTADALGMDPARCLVIEDSRNGVLAGVAAGMTVCGFTGGGHADEGLAARLEKAGANHVVSAFADIERLLERR